LGLSEVDGVIVMKFGGSSVADAECIRAAAEIVRQRVDRRPVVVVSALAGVTDLLEQALEAARRDDLEGLDPLLADLERRHSWALAGCIDVARQRHHLGLEIDRLFEQLRQRLRSVRILGEETPRVRDAVLASGETLSARIVAAAFREWELPARWVDPEQVMATDERFGEASPEPLRVRECCRASLLPVLDGGGVPVLGGFVGASSSGATTTLGRGGSDTTATVLGLALEAEEIQIWTDVDGLMSADPRCVPAARSLARVSFAEAAELAIYGARVLHADAIAPAVRRQIPVRVLNSRRPEGPGTLVVGDTPDGGRSGPVAIASKAGVSVVRVVSRRMPMDARLPGQVLVSCREAELVPQLVLSSATTVTVVGVCPDELSTLAGVEDSADIQFTRDCAIVCVVGAAVDREPQMLARLLAELASWEPELVTTGATRASVVAVVRAAGLADGVRRLHSRFLEGEVRG
jgi:aspartate kinase